MVRKTCCVNKLYVFCSNLCMQAWTRSWLGREGTSVVSHRKTAHKKKLVM